MHTFIRIAHVRILFLILIIYFFLIILSNIIIQILLILIILIIILNFQLIIRRLAHFIHIINTTYIRQLIL